MKIKLIIFAILTIHISIFATAIDSLLADLDKPEVDKGALYNKLSLEYLQISPSKSVEYAELAIKNTKSKVLRVDYLNQLGIAYEYSGEYPEAILQYETAINIAQSSSYEKGEGIALLNIAIVKTQLADYDNSLDFLLRAMNIFDEINDIKNLTVTYNSLGNLYLQLNNTEQALYYYKIALKNKEEKLNDPEPATVLHNLALVYLDMEKWAEASEFLDRSLASMQKKNDKFAIAYCYNSFSFLYSSQENYEKAIRYNLMALNMFEEIENLEGIAYTNNQLASSYLHLERYNQAISALQRSMELAVKIQLNDIIADNYQIYSEYYKAKGNYKQALDYLELYNIKNDSIFSEAKNQKITTLEHKLELKSKEKKISKLQENQNYQKKITIILIVVLIFGVIVLIFLIFLFQEKIREIGIRQETEKRLTESQNRFQQLADNISIAIFTFNIEGVFTYVNPSTVNITGYSEEELLSMKFFNIVHPEDKEMVMGRGFNRIKGEGVRQQYAFRIITKQHEIKWMEIFNSRAVINDAVVVLGTASDITERKDADIRIHESEKRYKHLVESIEEGLVIADEFENFIFTNKAARDIFGFTEEEMSGMNFKQLVSDEDYAKLQLETDKRIKGESSKYELGVICKNGDKRLLTVTASPLVDDGDYTATIAIFVDITDIRKADKKIKSQLREKEVMLQEIYHRVKNNLQIISSMLKLQASYVEDEYAKKMFQNCQNRVKSMSLVHEKLYRSNDLSQISFKDYTETLIKNLFTSLNITGNRIKYEIDIHDVYFNISAAIPCGLLINELITNALKYGFPDEREGIIKVSMHEIEDEKLKLTVWNNGVKLPDDFSMENLDSFGMRLVDILKLQLEAELIIDQKEGVAFSLIFTKRD